MPAKIQKLTWQAPEFRHFKKNAGWYIALIASAVLIIGFFVITQQDYFAAITIGILTGLVVFFSRQEPQILEIQLTPKGIHYGNIHVPYKQIKHFWVVDGHPHKSVNFETTTYLNRMMVLELEEQDPEEVREFLLAYLPEHEGTEPTITQKIIHWLKF